MKRLTEDEIHKLGEDLYKGKTARDLLAAIKDDQATALSGAVIASFMSHAGVEPTDIVGPVISKDAYRKGVMAAAMTVHVYLEAINEK